MDYTYEYLDEAFDAESQKDIKPRQQKRAPLVPKGLYKVDVTKLKQSSINEGHTSENKAAIIDHNFEETMPKGNLPSVPTDARGEYLSHSSDLNSGHENRKKQDCECTSQDRSDGIPGIDTTLDMFPGESRESVVSAIKKELIRINEAAKKKHNRENISMLDTSSKDTIETATNSQFRNNKSGKPLDSQYLASTSQITGTTLATPTKLY